MSISKHEEIAAIPDEEIDTSDIPELDQRFWEKARLVLPEPKKPISLRVDAEVLDWYRSQGGGYQSLMDAVLLSYMEAKKKSRPSVRA